MSESVVVPSDRDIRATLDEPAADSCVIACPPHPQMGGSRSDGRLRAVSDALECACLRFDYGEWDEGYGELADARDALAWARDRYGRDRVALFGYSFGGCIALLAAARESEGGRPPVAVSALAPASRLADDLDAAAAVDAIDCPLQIVYGERDGTVDWEPVVERARERDAVVEGVGADHFFVNRTAAVGELIGEFLGARLTI